ncbi:MAG: hypothetical protein HY885_05175 [Deltaproteobacteria bacterium]|nr:hypothetical protein [Deltaproteobacteria bacterium]
MILHPGIMALLLGSVIVALMLLYASAMGVKILLQWDFQSSSAGQLALERRTCLISTLISYAFGFVVLSGFLYVYTVDDIHQLFVGAMCAVGSLNANPIGWYVLWTKIGSFFLAAVWLALNYFDQRAEDFPLVKLKYIFLLLVVPVVFLDLYYESMYFLGLHPEIITSCCGSLFADSGSAVAGSLAGLPVKPMMGVFYLFLLLHSGAGILCLLTQATVFRYALSLLSLLFFFVAMAAIISYISLYIYELPTHHCPFDILQKEYHFIGYPLYTTLFLGVLYGLFPGLFQPLKRLASLREEVKRAERIWVALSMLALTVFALLSSWPVWFGNLTMQGYY